MTLKTGLNAQCGIKKESSYGTPVTVDNFLPFKSESFSSEIARIGSESIRAGQRVIRSQDWNPGVVKITGSLDLEVWTHGYGEVLELMFGTASTAGTASPYTHSYDDTADIPSATVEFGIPSVDGTVRPYRYHGAMVESWELSAAVNEAVQLSLSFIAQSETTSGSVASASYPASADFLTFVGGSISVSGSSVPVTSVTVQGNNGLQGERFFIGQTNTSQPLESTKREYTGSIEPEFTSNALYDIYRDADEVALVLDFASTALPTFGLTVTMNVRLDGTTPQVGGTEAVTNPMEFKAIDAGSGSINVDYITADATP